MSPAFRVRRLLVPITGQPFVSGSAVVRPICGTFLGTLSRQVRRLELSGTQKRVSLSRGADFRAALKVYRNADPQVVAQARNRAAAVGSR